MSTPPLTTRQPSARPSWPLILLAGAPKAGKSYAGAVFSGSELVQRTFWIEVGETSADAYGAVPGARYEICDHDGTFRSLANAVWAAARQPRQGQAPHAIVLDSATAVWDLLTDEQQQIANQRRASPRGEATITMDQWNSAKKKWHTLVQVLREHNGPVILTARLEQTTVVAPDGTPTTEKAWRVRAEKNLPFDVDAVVQMPAPGQVLLTGVRSLALPVPSRAHRPYPDFTIERLLRDMGFGTHPTEPSPDPAASEPAP